MRPAPKLIAAATIALAAMLALATAVFAAQLIEGHTSTEIRRALAQQELSWPRVEADGLLIHLTGTAPDEKARFRALTVAGDVVDPSRVIDEIQVAPSETVDAPEFALELLRNGTGVSLIGLVPAGQDRAAISRAVARAAKTDDVADMLNTADYPAPEGWAEALNYGLEALTLLPRAKISVRADRVTITAISDSANAKSKLESELARKAPEGLRVALDISAPRPVITPFVLRFVTGADGARFDACSADTPEAAERILEAAHSAGLEGKASCAIGLGVPTPDWAAAVETGINALAELGSGKLTFSDADVSLVVPATVPQASFDRVAGELETDLPDVFSLHAVRLEPEDEAKTEQESAPPEFVATKSPEGQVQLRGRITDELTRKATESYARARFGIDNVYPAMRLAPDLPEGWPIRVLTALEGLSELNNGRVIVRPDMIDLSGVTGKPEARAQITQLFAEKLGGTGNFAIDVTYREELDPEAAKPTPEECLARIRAIQAEQKITFEPGSTTLQGDSLDVVEKIADVLKECPDVQMEIGGHTDSQGREEMNQTLSQQRADAVLTALMARRILTSNLIAKGYGEAEPIADNDTEEGREANRRIDFKLIGNEDAEDGGAAKRDGETATGAPDATDEAVAETDDGKATPAATDTAEEKAQTGTDKANEQN